MDEHKCIICGRETEGWKCEECGAQSENHDENHTCGATKCVPKCTGCDKAETQCTCSARETD